MGIDFKEILRIFAPLKRLKKQKNFCLSNKQNKIKMKGF